MVDGAIIIDLGFGDSGKGTVTDFYCRQLQAEWVVRFNGGAQAGHNVVTDDGRHHTFSQFGAGMFLPWVRTYLSRFVVVHPGGLLEEAKSLLEKGVTAPLERLIIDPECPVITPFHQVANRMRELLRGKDRHGSCGLGVGETVSHSIEHPEEALRAKHFSSPRVCRRKLRAIQSRYWDEFSGRREEIARHPRGLLELAVLESERAETVFLTQARALQSNVTPFPAPRGKVVFEGAQGVLLDEWRGFHPHTTWSTCTFRNALELCQEWECNPLKLGVVRSYATRHGAGPFPTERRDLNFPEPHNGWGPWQHGFRQGWLDLPLLRYAIEVCGPLEGLVVTHLDLVTENWKVCTKYHGALEVEPGPYQDLSYQEELGRRLNRVEPNFEPVEGPTALLGLLKELATPVLGSWGATARDKRWLSGEKVGDPKLYNLK